MARVSVPAEYYLNAAKTHWVARGWPPRVAPPFVEPPAVATFDDPATVFDGTKGFA